MANVSTGVIGAFESASAVRTVAPGRHALDIPDGWQQGRGAFGGLVLGGLLRAALAEEPDADRRTRTLVGDICAPVLQGPAEARVRVLRRGNNQTNLAAELVQGGAVVALVSVVLAAPRAPTVAPLSSGAPRGKVWRELDVAPIAAPLGPVFAAHYEYRIDGRFPFSSGPEAVAEGTIRERVPSSKLDAPAVIGLLDAWYPALFTTLDAPRPCATVSFTAELFVDPAALDPATPLRHRGRVVELRDGYFLELRELWADDVLVAANQQTFAVLK